MNRILFTAFILLATSIFTVKAGNDDKKAEGTATKTFSGRVVDQATGESLAGVKLSIEGNNEVIYTDLDGNFSITGNASGSILKVSYISYQTSLVKDLENNNQTLQIKLKPLAQ
jgi:hypothetical protein